MKNIRTKKGLQELLRRCKAKGLYEAVDIIKGCLTEGLEMDEMDYQNLGKEYRQCCEGLR